MVPPALAEVGPLVLQAVLQELNYPRSQSCTSTSPRIIRVLGRASASALRGGASRGSPPLPAHSPQGHRGRGHFAPGAPTQTLRQLSGVPQP